MKPYWANYEKIEAYFKSLPGGIHPYIVNELGGDFNAALLNSLKSNINRAKQYSGAYSEMKELFDKILREEYKKELSVYNKVKSMR
ncbi:MAG: hypothetical protein R3Y04_04930 [Rikenellaceae bacterium]